MPGRTFSSPSYRYGFNGKEKDNETTVDGGDYDFGARIYDSRLGRWLSIDPIFQAHFSPYVAFNNSPIYFLDPDGKYSIGDKTNSKASFLKVFAMWEVAANEHLIVPRLYVVNSHRKLQLIDDDYRAPEQQIKTVGTGKDKIENFSYNKNLGKYVDLGGFPLDAVHFFKCASLATNYSEWVVKWAAVDEEEDQASVSDPKGRSSAFAPEDMLSNYLGIYFGSDMRANENMTEELTSYFKEIETLFSTNTLENGKYLTAGRIKELRAMIKKYYDTEDFRDFQKNKPIYKIDNITEINENAAEDKLPLIEDGGK